MLPAMRRSIARARRTPLAFLLGIACGAGTIACGEDVLVGRFLLRSSVTDAGVDGDAGPPDNLQSFNAERAREHARDRETNKDDPHDNRPSDKSH